MFYICSLTPVGTNGRGTDQDEGQARQQGKGSKGQDQGSRDRLRLRGIRECLSGGSSNLKVSMLIAGLPGIVSLVMNRPPRRLFLWSCVILGSVSFMSRLSITLLLLSSRESPLSRGCKHVYIFIWSFRHCLRHRWIPTVGFPRSSYHPLIQKSLWYHQSRCGAMALVVVCLVQITSPSNDTFYAGGETQERHLPFMVRIPEIRR